MRVGGDLIRRLVEENGLGEDVYRRAHDIVRKFYRRYRRPARGKAVKYEGVAAAAVYAASLELGYQVPYRRLADGAGVNHMTLRNSFDRILRYVIREELERKYSRSKSTR